MYIYIANTNCSLAKVKFVIFFDATHINTICLQTGPKVERRYINKTFIDIVRGNETSAGNFILADSLAGKLSWAANLFPINWSLVCEFL